MLRNKITQLCKSLSQTRTIHTTSLKLEEIGIEKSINEVRLLGRVGNDPQKRGTEEHPVVTFSIATHNHYRYESGDTLQRTEWHRIAVFRPYLRDTVEKFLKKGQRVFVTGRLSYGEMKSEDGQIKNTTSVIADDIIFLQSSTKSDNKE